jgi:hypothetical protein
MKRKQHRNARDDEKATPLLSKEDEARRKYRRKRRFLRTGQIIMLAGALIAVSHWFAHVGMFGAQPSLWTDFWIGYPTAGLFLIAGAITAGQK